MYLEDYCATAMSSIGQFPWLMSRSLCRKIDDNPLDDQTRGAIKGFCVKLVESLNKYYAFGSCYVDDNT